MRTRDPGGVRRAVATVSASKRGFCAASLVLGFLLVSACAPPRAGAPQGSIPDLKEVSRDVYGSWASVESFLRPDPLAGELIAVHEDSLYLLMGDGNLQTVALSHISEATVVTHIPPSGLILWTALGMLSTVSHGVYLSFSAPTWFLVGTISSTTYAQTGNFQAPVKHVKRSHRSRRNDASPMSTSKDKVLEQRRLFREQVRPFARFPPGLPPGLQRHALQVRPVKPKRKPNVWQIAPESDAPSEDSP